jgi:hypothetical protein
MNDKLKLIDYQDNDSIWPWGASANEQSGAYLQTTPGQNSIMCPAVANDTIIYQYHILNKQETIVRSPLSLVGGLAMIGGLLALFQMRVILVWFHERQFEAKLKSDLNIIEEIPQIQKN